MKKEIGLWIDHKQAVVVVNLTPKEAIKKISSNMEKHPRYSGEGHFDNTEDGSDQRFDNQLNLYYDKVIACIDDADSILILGPGEAKGELQKRLEDQALGARIVDVETADSMSNGQLVAKIREYFKANINQQG